MYYNKAPSSSLHKQLVHVFIYHQLPKAAHVRFSDHVYPGQVFYWCVLPVWVQHFTPTPQIKTVFPTKMDTLSFGDTDESH